MNEKSVPREHYTIQKEGKEIGEVSSGTFSPTLKQGIGMGFVNSEFAEVGTQIEILIRGKLYRATQVKRPIYKFKGGIVMEPTNIPENLHYTKEHEWVKVEGDTLIIGITDYAQHALTDIVFVELPEVGKKTEQSKAFLVVESVKSVSDVYAPTDGEVVEVNTELTNKPELINEDPYGAGWIVKIKGFSQDQLNGLLNAEAYKQLLESH